MSQHISTTTKSEAIGSSGSSAKAGPTALQTADSLTLPPTHSPSPDNQILLESLIAVYRKQGYLVLPAQTALRDPERLFSTRTDLEQLRFGTQRSGWNFGVAPLWLDLPDRGVVEKGDMRTPQEQRIYESVLGAGVLALLQAIRADEELSVGIMKVNRVKAGQGFGNHVDGANSPTLRDTVLWYPNGSESHPLEVLTKGGEWVSVPAGPRELLLLDRDTHHMLPPRELEGEKPRLSLVVTSRA